MHANYIHSYTMQCKLMWPKKLHSILSWKSVGVGEGTKWRAASAWLAMAPISKYPGDTRLWYTITLEGAGDIFSHYSTTNTFNYTED